MHIKDNSKIYSSKTKGQCIKSIFYLFDIGNNYISYELKNQVY